jgi:outer membrane biosynthesis protein TonB
MQEKIEHKKQSFLMTTLLFLLLFLLLFYLNFDPNDPPLNIEGGGGGGDIAVNFGNSDLGSGKNFESTEEVSKPAPKVKVQKIQEQEALLTNQSDEDAPVVQEIKKPKKIIKEIPKEVPKKVVEVAKPKPSKSATDALANVLNSNTKGGDGEDDVAGNKGKSYGDPTARGYNGGGGSGTGSGGGNGSGQGIGTGSGYGAGSGGGRGSGNGNYQLGGRKNLNKPQPNYICDEQGVVVVQIAVDPSGKVISANPGVKGTTNSARCLLDQAKIAALNTKWQPDNNAPDKQVGRIIYNFSLK